MWWGQGEGDVQGLWWLLIPLQPQLFLRRRCVPCRRVPDHKRLSQVVQHVHHLETIVHLLGANDQTFIFLDEVHSPNSLDIWLEFFEDQHHLLLTPCAHCPAQSGIPQTFGKTSRRGSRATLPPGLLLSGWTSAYQETNAFLP